MADDITLQSIKITASADTSKATTSLNALAAALERIGKVTKSFEDATKAVGSLVTLADRFSKMDLSKLADQFDKVAKALERVSNAKLDTAKVNAAVKAANAITRRQENAAREASKSAANQIKADRIATQKERLKVLSENAATARMKQERLAQKDLSGTTSKNGGRATGNKEEELAAKEAAKDAAKVERDYARWANGGKATEEFLKRQAELLQRFASAAKKAGTAFARFIGNMALSPFKKLGSALKDIVSRFTGFLAAVKRIAVYRAIRFVLKEITQAFKEGTENLYQYSKAINGVFAQSMDMLATSALYAKNSLAAMASPLINALAPAIDYIVDKFVDFINVVNELIATLTGAATWTKALKYPKEFAEAADGANGKAKELRATLLGFDEINRLDDNRRSSRGSADELIDYSKMFEEQEVTTKAKGFIQAVKDAFKEGNFNDIGKTLGEKIKKGLDKINWDSIKDRVNKNASSVATLINGIISVPELADSVGKSIAEAFNTAIGKINTFFTSVNWRGVGEFLGRGLNTIIDTFDSAGLGRTLASIVNSGVAAISGFINSVDWFKVADFIADGINGFFNEINVKELGGTISDVLVRAANAAAELLRKTDFNAIGEKIGQLLNEIDWAGFLSGLAQTLFTALGGVIDALGRLIKESPVFGTIAAIAIANKIAVALGAPKITALLGSALANLVTGGAAGAATTATASAATATVAGAATGGLASKIGMVFGSSVSALPVSVIAMSSVAAAMIGYGVGSFLNEIPAVADFADSVIEFFGGGITTMSGGWDRKDVNYSSRLDSIIDNTNAIKTNTGNSASYASSIKSRVDTIKAHFTTMASNAMIVADPKTITALKGYADGGYPETGSVFLAGERGAELISSSSSGTQVSNRDQIAVSVASGMQAANEEQNDLLRQLVGLGQAILEKDTTITTDSISNALGRSNIRAGRTVVVTGG